MKKIIFDNLMIADYHMQTAYSTSFFEGINVVTSADNKYGKSSTMKPLYYTLGAEVAFDEDWGKSKTSIFWIFELMAKNIEFCD